MPQAIAILRKLQAFTSEYEQQQRSSVSLGSKLHPTYEKALAKVQRAQEWEGEEEQQEAEQAQRAQQRERQQQQQQQGGRAARCCESGQIMCLCDSPAAPLPPCCAGHASP